MELLHEGDISSNLLFVDCPRLVGGRSGDVCGKPVLRYTCRGRLALLLEHLDGGYLYGSAALLSKTAILGDVQIVASLIACNSEFKWWQGLDFRLKDVRLQVRTRLAAFRNPLPSAAGEGPRHIPQNVSVGSRSG